MRSNLCWPVNHCKALGIGNLGRLHRVLKFAPTYFWEPPRRGIFPDRSAGTMRLVGYGEEGMIARRGCANGRASHAVCGNARPKVSIYSGYGPGAAQSAGSGRDEFSDYRQLYSEISPALFSRNARMNHWNFSSSAVWPISRSSVMGSASPRRPEPCGEPQSRGCTRRSGRAGGRQRVRGQRGNPRRGAVQPARQPGRWGLRPGLPYALR